VKPVLAVVVAVLMADAASADMSTPLHTRVPTRTTVMLEKPIPGYFFYAYGDGYAVRLPLDTALGAEVPNLASRMLLLAVPATIAERFPTAELLAKQLETKFPDGVQTFEFKAFFDEFPLDTRRDDKLRIVIRQGKDGIEFEETKRPQSSGSCWVMLAGLGWTVLAILFGFRWARRGRNRQ
jgi:hypothetical protein